MRSSLVLLTLAAGAAAQTPLTSRCPTPDIPLFSDPQKCPTGSKPCCTEGQNGCLESACGTGQVCLPRCCVFCDPCQAADGRADGGPYERAHGRAYDYERADNVYNDDYIT